MSYTPPGSPPPPPSEGYGYGYGQPGYPPPGYGAPVANQTNGLAIAALVTGLLSIFCLPPLGIVAVPLGIAAMSKAKRVGTGKGMGIAGLITGIIGILATIAFVIAVVVAADEASDTDEMDDTDIICVGERVGQDPDDC